MMSDPEHPSEAPEPIYSRGGYIRTERPIAVTLDDDECVIGRDMRCQRRDSAHYRDRVELRTLGGHVRAEWGACYHRHALPVESVVDGETVAWLCRHCDEQLPA